MLNPRHGAALQRSKTSDSDAARTTNTRPIAYWEPDSWTDFAQESSGWRIAPFRTENPRPIPPLRGG